MALPLPVRLLVEWNRRRARDNHRPAGAERVRIIIFNVPLRRRPIRRCIEGVVAVGSAIDHHQPECGERKLPRSTEDTRRSRAAPWRGRRAHGCVNWRSPALAGARAEISLGSGADPAARRVDIQYGRARAAFEFDIAEAVASARSKKPARGGGWRAATGTTRPVVERRVTERLDQEKSTNTTYSPYAGRDWRR